MSAKKIDSLSSDTVPEAKAREHRPGTRHAALPWLLLLLAAAGAAYFYYWIFEPTRAELAATRLRLIDAQKMAATQHARIKVLNQNLDELRGTSANLAATIAAREKEIDELIGAEEELTEKLYSQIAAGDIAVRQNQGQLVVDLVDKLLFPSGEADLSDAGKKALRQVGETFLKVPDKVIQVGGHTDDVPISPKLKERFAGNWDLSTARALNVVRFLEDEVKVPGSRLVAAGFSEFRPIAPNTNKTGRRKNRRIEVTLLPLVPAPNAK